MNSNEIFLLLNCYSKVSRLVVQVWWYGIPWYQSTCTHTKKVHKILSTMSNKSYMTVQSPKECNTDNGTMFAEVYLILLLINV